MEVIHIKQPYKKSYTIQINRDGNVVVKTHALFSRKKVDALVLKHKDWISKRLQEFAALQTRKAEYARISINEGTVLSILGENYTIQLQHTKTKKVSIDFIDSTIRISGPLTILSDANSLKEILKKELKKSVKDIFAARASYYAKLYNLSYNEITVKDQKTKWGSCSSKRNLNFNWKLLFAPKDILDYVVLHEICHLGEMNHSRNFWKLVARHCPDYQQKKRWLRDNSERLRYILV